MAQRAQRTSCMSSLRRNGVAAVSSQTGHARFKKLLVWLMVLLDEYIKTNEQSSHPKHRRCELFVERANKMTKPRQGRHIQKMPALTGLEDFCAWFLQIFRAYGAEKIPKGFHHSAQRCRDTGAATLGIQHN